MNGEVKLPPVDMKALQRMGASERLNQINQERLAILAAFPGLLDQPVTDPPAEEPAKVEPRQPHRRRMTPAQRAEVSARMKAYWRERHRQRR